MNADSKTPLLQIAEATVDIPELVRGVEGEVQVEGLQAVREAHAAFVANGWQRVEKKEGWSKLEHRVYRLRKNGNTRWLKMTVANFFGVFGEFEVSEQEPF